jgi:hypothetical protein
MLEFTRSLVGTANAVFDDNEVPFIMGFVGAYVE